jgi:hypothetical protein
MPVVTDIDLGLVFHHRDHQRYEASFKKTLGNIEEYVASRYGGTGDTLDYIVQAETSVKPESEDTAENYNTVDQEMTDIVPHSGRAVVNDMRKVWDIMSNI